MGSLALQEPSLGTFVFHSSKAARLHDAAQGRCIAHMFAMRVEEELPVWPEQRHRERLWVNFNGLICDVYPLTLNVQSAEGQIGCHLSRTSERLRLL